MTKPVHLRLPSDLVEAARRVAAREGISLTALATRAIEADLLRREFAEHARMVAEAEDAESLAVKSRAVRDGLSRWKQGRSSGAA
ncbi:hypothetical protein [Nocardia arizonensis]|uniref:hypothetical protein n=1 Tax=Nocardia arizonensis TaxID=1141647 RepID=UPI0012E23027|nr:hypothetical protein [Nocardia arizonensis]